MVILSQLNLQQKYLRGTANHQRITACQCFTPKFLATTFCNILPISAILILRQLFHCGPLRSTVCLSDDFMDQLFIGIQILFILKALEQTSLQAVTNKTLRSQPNDKWLFLTLYFTEKTLKSNVKFKLYSVAQSHQHSTQVTRLSCQILQLLFKRSNTIM